MSRRMHFTGGRGEDGVGASLHLQRSNPCCTSRPCPAILKRLSHDTFGISALSAGCSLTAKKKKMKWVVTPETVCGGFRTAANVFATAMFHRFGHTQRLQGCNKLSRQQTPCSEKSPNPLLACLSHSWPA